MNYDTKLELRMVDPKTNRTYYTEPFTLNEHTSFDLPDTIEAFETGCQDALKDIERDIERGKKFGTFSDWDLATELAARGYDVKKRC
jgi:hypothetical protein